MYLEVDPLNIEDPIRLFVFVGNPGSPGYVWNIKITMIDCKLNSALQGCFMICQHFTALCLTAPFGCLQYFTTPSGVFESLNYGSGPGTPYLANTKYAVCFRSAVGFCGLRFSSLAGEFIVNSNSAGQEVGGGSECHNYTMHSNNDFVQVLGAWTLLGANKIEEAYYCGGTPGTAVPDIYGEEQAQTSLDIIFSASSGPLVMLVQTDDGVKFADGVLIGAADSANETLAQQELINQRERGFRISYSLTPC